MSEESTILPAALRTGLLCDTEILDLCKHQAMISPCVSEQVRKDCISYGISSYGYDIRVAGRFKIFTNIHTGIIDPKDFDDSIFIEVNKKKGEACIIPPNSFVLAESMETFRIPNDILGICTGKSTLARCGLSVPMTPLEPGWEGVLTIEVSNTTPLPSKIYAEEGIAQILFIRGASPCAVSYADKKGKYQHQKGLTLPRIA